ncbi:MAG: hypothetical protein NC132_03980 [Corallococcus sp.]|nr:hypothetical protein [Corallococcus sp.]MCM1359817.1 hypothetical protein [Corallococcus sp.]MCM1395251.1 hypothetical protein [Corallococcus sp.]
MNTKRTKTSGADERTPSKSEYFSWINNTNEGSTERQTLINLDFFAYLNERYGMQLDIYAWDAGNLDGANGNYESLDSAKIVAQYPNGYEPIVERAAQIGTRLGVWGGADGYGDTKQDVEKRRNLIVGLCKKYDWALFKFDTVCGALRKNKRKEFAKTMRLARKYSPDLILLNHRNELGNVEKYATTRLWEGQETYVEAHVYNTITAPHNRAYMFFRGHTPNNSRLTEDHGVCLSSSLDFFEDDLVYQAFNRCLILAPEIYGNPWLLRDDELPRLAHVFNLHRKYRDILVRGFALDENLYGNNAFVRGDGKRRFISTGNAGWQDKTVSVRLDKSIGLKKCSQVFVRLHYPYEQFIGIYPYGATAEVALPSFRAALIEICELSVAEPMLTNCKYKTVSQKDGEYKLLSVFGKVQKISPNGQTEPVTDTSDIELFDESLASPRLLGELAPTDLPDNARQLYEFACFFADNDSFEYRSLVRSGTTDLPCVQRARDAFFDQPSYRLRGLETSIPFDNDPDTVFDTKSRLYQIYHGPGYRVNGGCLRVDLGKDMSVDTVEIEFFDGLQDPPHVFAEQTVRDNFEFSSDLQTWKKATLTAVQELGKYDLTYFDYYVDSPRVNNGLRKKAVFNIEGRLRYFSIPDPVDRIFSIKAFAKGKQIVLQKPHLTNLFSPYDRNKTQSVAVATVRLPEQLPLHPYLAVAVEGHTGHEGVTCVAKIDGEPRAFPNRAPAYPANVYECYVHPAEGNYTFYMPVDKQWKHKDIEVICSFVGEPVPVCVYLCDGDGKRDGIDLKIKL